MSSILKPLINASMPDLKIKVDGTMKLPSDEVPSVKGTDYKMDAVFCYQAASGWSSGEMCQAWIRRAVHAEAFARALEKELEQFRCLRPNS